MEIPKIDLKLSEPGIDPNNPWQPDKLGRQEIAEALTNLVHDQLGSLVVSLNGGWGTGKTFLLKRWQQDLKNKKFAAIYFNAWEDDFCADPLVSIIGQLGESLKEMPIFKDMQEDIWKKIKKAAKPLIIKNVLSLLNKFTGMSFDELVEQFADEMLERYQEQRDSLNQLKKSLKELAEKVKEETKLPLVFIIDELDRCRPLFAIELLERVKHIFSVPNMVFVLGLNRQELSKSVRAIYGDIDPDGYLRRFLDMEFLLPQADAQGFCRHLIERYRLIEFYNAIGSNDPSNTHLSEFNDIWEYLPPLLDDLGLSLRDIDWCLRAFTFVGRNIRLSATIWPFVILVLLVLRVKDMELYQRFINKECPSSDVLNRLEQWIPYESASDSTKACLDNMECYLYHMEAASNINHVIHFEQLNLLKDGQDLTQPEYLSSRTQKSDRARVDKLLDHLRDIGRNAGTRIDDIRNAYGLIELVG